MKKLLALLLVLCTLVGLVACGKKDPSASKNPTTGGNTITPTGTVEDPDFNVTPETSPYKGKTLELWGFGTDESYTQFDSFGKGNYQWMMKAAVDEWAAMNGVTIVYKGAYKQATILGEINSGEKPDLVFQQNGFPAISNAGITTAWTDEEYAMLAAICGEEYLDLMNYAGESHGLIVPWTGTMMLYYNQTMFDEYGVKSPKEYFMEGEWTWENFMLCMEEMTKDVNSDGTIDTYGVAGNSWGRLVNTCKYDESGKLLSPIDEPYIQDFFQMKYDGYAKQLTLDGSDKISSNVTYPMVAMQISDCEPYNFEHMFRVLRNTNELGAVPVPEWRGKNGETLGTSGVTQSAIQLCAATDEREAAVNLVAYVLKCGLKYVSDYSLGVVKSEYPGIQGKSELSAKWKEAFAKVCTDRAAAIKEIPHYDEELVAKVNTYLEDKGLFVKGTLSGVKELTTYAEIKQMPPASSIPAIREKYQATLDTYNNTYIVKN